MEDDYFEIFLVRSLVIVIAIFVGYLIIYFSEKVDVFTGFFAVISALVVAIVGAKILDSIVE